MTQFVTTSLLKLYFLHIVFNMITVSTLSLQTTTNAHWVHIIVMMMPHVPIHMDHFTAPVMLDLLALVSTALV